MCGEGVKMFVFEHSLQISGSQLVGQDTTVGHEPFPENIYSFIYLFIYIYYLSILGLINAYV